MPGDAAPQTCAFCPSPARRRGLCWACYSKFRECSLSLPPKHTLGRPTTGLRGLLRRFTPEARAELKAALAEVEADEAAGQ